MSVNLNNFNKEILNSVPNCEGKSDWGHRVFVTTNESLQSKTLGTLSRQPLIGDTIIGVSGFFILNAAAVRGTACSAPLGEIKNIILIDRSLRVEHFWEQMPGIITSSSDCAEVIQKVKNLLRGNSDKYYENTSNYPCQGVCEEYIGWLEKEIKSGDSWLSSEAKFVRIKKIFEADRFVFKRADLSSPETFKAMGQILKEKGAVIDTLYLSNTFEYMKLADEQSSYIASVEHLIAPKTLIVYTRARGCHTCEELQQVVMRKNESRVIELFSPQQIKQCQPNAHSNKTNVASLTLQELLDLVGIQGLSILQGNTTQGFTIPPELLVALLQGRIAEEKNLQCSA